MERGIAMTNCAACKKKNQPKNIDLTILFKIVSRDGQ